MRALVSPRPSAPLRSLASLVDTYDAAAPADAERKPLLDERAMTEDLSAPVARAAAAATANNNATALDFGAVDDTDTVKGAIERARTGDRRTSNARCVPRV